MRTVLLRRLMDTVEAVDLADPNRDFAEAGVVLLALAISRLSSADREGILQDIESGALRRAAEQFINLHPQNRRRH